MRLAIVALAALSFCRPAPPPPPPDPCAGVPVPPETEQCHLIGQHCDCYHRPPGECWQLLPCEEPPPPECPWIGIVGGWGDPIDAADRDPQMAGQVRGAMVAVGERCGESATGTLEILAAYLRGQGYCAEGSSSDALAIEAPDGLVEEWHPVSFGNGCWTNSGQGKYIGARPKPPDSSGCPAPLPPRERLEWRVKAHGPHWYDATPIVTRSCAFCEAIGMGRMGDGTIRCSCPARPDNHADRVTCEAYLVGPAPVWHSDGETIVHPSNAYQANCAGCTWLEVCDATGETCARQALQ